MNTKLRIGIVLTLLAAYAGFIGWVTASYPVEGDAFLYYWRSRFWSVGAYLRYGYFVWGLRDGVFFSMLLAPFGYGVWQLLNPLVHLLLLVGAFRLTEGEFRPWRSSRETVRFAILLLLLWVGCARPRDTVFWFSGSLDYGWSCCSVIWFLNLVRDRWNAPRLRIPAAILVLLWGVFAGISNENLSILGTMTAAGLPLFLHWQRRRIPPVLGIAGAGWIIGTLIMFTAPGIWNRAAATDMAGAFNVWGRIRLLLPVLAFWGCAAAPSLLLLGAAVLRFRFRIPAVVWCPAAVSLLLALAFAGAGTLPAMRAYFAGSVFAAIAAAESSAELWERRAFRQFAAEAVLLLAFAAAVLVPAIPDTFVIRADSRRRAEQIAAARQRGERNPVVTPYRSGRRWLWHYVFTEDVTADPDFFVNRYAALYYDVDSIATDGSGAVPPRFFRASGK